MPLGTLKKALSSVVIDFDEKYVLPGESKTTAKEDLLNELAHDVLFFDDWYFTAGTEEPDERVDRIKGTSNNGLISAAIRVEMENIAAELEELDLPKFDIDEVVGKLTYYVESWKDWYYKSKVVLDQGEFFDSRNEHLEAYIEDNYGYDEKSQGVSNVFWDDKLPYSENDVEVETVTP